ncbi:hypothetical protein M5W98_30255, partial [Paenibacillus apiarius]|nr:hypothetical protein [Paenibacillus apiarius]
AGEARARAYPPVRFGRGRWLSFSLRQSSAPGRHRLRMIAVKGEGRHGRRAVVRRLPVAGGTRGDPGGGP